jgi:Transcriptional regulators
MAQVSLKDIANILGVSSATVSLVLNGKEKEGRVSKELSDKIRKQATLMNYKPNNLARGLRVGKSQTIGLIVADISNTFFSSLAFHIQEYAESLGYAVIIANTNESDAKMEKMINVLRSRQVDGLIVVPTENGENAIADIAKSGTPLVLLDRTFPNLQVNHVMIDNYQASKKALQHLINKGCKRPSLIIYNNTLSHMQERKRGYVDALQQAGLYDPNLIKEVDYNNLKGDIVDAVDYLLKEEKKVDAIFFATNTISMIGLKRMFELNVEVQQEVQVVCFDKNDVFDFTTQVSIPYITQPIPEMGHYSVDLLVEQIDKKKSISGKIELFAELTCP